MQLLNAVWAFVLTIADYPARLGSQLSPGISDDTALSALKNQHILHPISNNCVNSPKHRECWQAGFDIKTDYELHTPNTGKTRYVSTWVIHS